MREELKNMNWHLYGLRIEDLDYTLRLVRDIIAGRKELLEQERVRLKREKPEDVTGEIISDLAHYNWVENQYLWHFCLWRMQAVYEHLVVQEILIKDNPRINSFYGGLRKLMTRVTEGGYQIPDDDLEDLYQWAELRNALSHQPPEMYRPGGLCEDDILEYVELLKRILTMLFAQQKTKKKAVNCE